MVKVQREFFDKKEDRDVRYYQLKAKKAPHVVKFSTHKLCELCKRPTNVIQWGVAHL